jgi:hypothetical protein
MNGVELRTSRMLRRALPLGYRNRSYDQRPNATGLPAAIFGSFLLLRHGEGQMIRFRHFLEKKIPTSSI